MKVLILIIDDDLTSSYLISWLIHYSVPFKRVDFNSVIHRKLKLKNGHIYLKLKILTNYYLFLSYFSIFFAVSIHLLSKNKWYKSFGFSHISLVFLTKITDTFDFIKICS